MNEVFENEWFVNIYLSILNLKKYFMTISSDTNIEKNTVLIKFI